MMNILVPETCWGNKTAYFVASSWFFTFHYIYLHYLRTLGLYLREYVPPALGSQITERCIGSFL
jgi:hypothetical protein